MGYSPSFGLEINEIVVARGNETLKQAVKSICYQNYDVIRRDQEKLNEFAAKVLDIISTEKARVSDNHCDPEDGKYSLFSSFL
jgi:hypothetical protein